MHKCTKHAVGMTPVIVALNLSRNNHVAFVMKADWWWVPQFSGLTVTSRAGNGCVRGWRSVRNKSSFHDHLCVCSLSAGQGLLPTVESAAGGV